MHSEPGPESSASRSAGAGPASSDAARTYWRRNLRILTVLLGIWFTVSLGLGILFVVPLNQFRLGGFPLGFWFSQQGAIYVFIVLIFVYARYMDHIEARLRIRSRIDP